MLSESKHKTETVFELRGHIARERAKRILNQKPHEHPPDIYFIRRNPRMLSRFLDEDEMSQVVRKAAPKLKNNYNLFSLDPREPEI